MRPTILLVDDEPFNLDYLEQELEDLDVDILTATNGQEALETVTQHPPDMIFLDIMMPVMDGFQVLEHLKADPRWNSIPVVIVSAASDMRSVVRGIELGADDFLSKPFNPILLHARLNAGLEKKRLRDVERRYLRSLERELEIGREIQAGFLPRRLPQPPGWQIASFFRPAREVAGDFFDVFALEDGQLALLIGDVTDKGVGSALFMALFRSLLRAVIMTEMLSADCVPVEDLMPGARLKRAVTLVNNYICTTHEAPMFATLFYGVLDTRSGELWYINAGHDLPYVLRDGAIHGELPATGPLVGAFPGVNYESKTLRLDRGDTLVLYSDGITDAKDCTQELFGKERWRFLLEQPISSLDERLPHLVDSVLGFVGDAPQYDDITLLLVRRL